MGRSEIATEVRAVASVKVVSPLQAIYVFHGRKNYLSSSVSTCMLTVV